MPFTKSALQYYDPDDLEGQPVGLESLMALYSFYEGQDNGPTGPPPVGTVREDDMSSELLGSYSAYGYLASTRLRAPFLGDAGARFQVAVSSIITAPGVPYGRKSFALNMVSGRMERRDADPGAPYQLAAPVSTITPRRSEDAIILWMNEYANRLVNGTYRVGKNSFRRYGNVHPIAMSILLYPNRTFGSATNECSSRVSRCVTRGVEVVASAVHAYEIRRAIYSIRIRIVQPGEEGYLSPSDRGFHSCQLRSRRWTLTSNETGEEEHVSGEGVMGFYPLLLDNGGHLVYYGRDADHASLIDECEEETFVYQSMSNVYEEEDERGGAMSGRLQFVPGSLRGPMGPEFDVVVASFPLPTFSDGDLYVY